MQTAGEEFRRRGIAETSLADLMSAAGLTHGGFYRHFESKDQLVAEACTVAMEDTLEKMAAVVAADGGRNGLEAAVKHYLSAGHRDDPADGCSLAALGSEIAYSDSNTRAAATEGLLKLVDLIADQLESSDPDIAKSRALAMVATMVGALTLSRLVADPNLSDAILLSAAEELISRH